MAERRDGSLFEPRICSVLLDELVVVGFSEQCLDVRRRLRLFEKTAKRVVTQLARNILQGSEVVAGPI